MLDDLIEESRMYRIDYVVEVRSVWGLLLRIVVGKALEYLDVFVDKLFHVIDTELFEKGYLNILDFRYLV